MIRQRHNGWVVPALGLGLVGLALYGFNEHQQRATLVATAMNAEQGDYHSLAYEATEMQTNLAKALTVRAVNTEAVYLQEAGQRAIAAHVYAGRLPMSAWPDGAALSFLNQVAKTTTLDTQQISRLGRLGPADQADVRTLNKVAIAFVTELRTAQTKMLETGVLSTSGGSASSQRQGVSRTLARGLASADRTAHAYTQEHKDSFAGHQSSEHGQGQTRLYHERVIAPAMAIASVRAFDDQGPRQGVVLPRAQVTRLGAGYGYKGYLVTLAARSGQPSVYAGVSLHGGHVMWLTRSSGAAAGHKTDLAQAQVTAQHFLDSHGYRGLALVATSEYDNRTSLSFAPVQENVAFYDKSVRVKVNMATGQVTSFDATSYWMQPPPTFSLHPQVTERSALRSLTPGMTAQNIRLAVISAPSGQQVLVYDVLAHKQGDTYRVYISAASGQPVSIDKLSQ